MRGIHGKYSENKNNNKITKWFIFLALIGNLHFVLSFLCSNAQIRSPFNLKIQNIMPVFFRIILWICFMDRVRWKRFNSSGSRLALGKVKLLWWYWCIQIFRQSERQTDFLDNQRRYQANQKMQPFCRKIGNQLSVSFNITKRVRGRWAISNPVYYDLTLCHQAFWQARHNIQ